MQIVAARLPAQHLANSRGLRNQHGGIAGAPGLLEDFKRAACGCLNRGEHFAHAVAVPVAAVEDLGAAAGAQVRQRLQVGVGQVLDMDVIAHPGAVGGVVVAAVNGDVLTLADRRLAGHLGQQRGLGRGLADAALRIAAGDIEITEHHVAERVHGGDIAQHPLAHQFGGAIGVDRLRW